MSVPQANCSGFPNTSRLRYRYPAVRCFQCWAWERMPGHCWWVGLCAVTGEAVGLHKRARCGCQLGEVKHG